MKIAFVHQKLSKFSSYQKYSHFLDWLYNHLNKDNNGVGAGVNLQAGNGFGVNANVGYNHQYISQGTSSFTDSSGTTWYETPSNYKKTESVSWQTSSDADNRKRK